MPRYFFHSLDGTLDRDEEGTLLLNDAAARLKAIQISGALLDEYPQLLDDGDFRVQVIDKGGRLVSTVLISVVDGSVVGHGA